MDKPGNQTPHTTELPGSNANWPRMATFDEFADRLGGLVRVSSEVHIDMPDPSGIRLDAALGAAELRTANPDFARQYDEGLRQ